MREELIELGKKLKELAIKYDEDYLTLSFVNGSVFGNNSTDSENSIDFYIMKEEEENEYN